MLKLEVKTYELTLRDALIAFGKTNLTESNDWYQWSINPKYLPASILLPPGTPFTQNVALKIELSRLYSSTDNQTKKEITRYYIADWGGIRSNRDETIQSYSRDTPESLIAKGAQGIASWSKALCIRNPACFAIYDARVAISLNLSTDRAGSRSPERLPSPFWAKQTYQSRKYESP